MYMFDNRITIENRQILEKYLNGFEYRASGMSFSAMFMWKDSNRFSWDMIGDYMCMSGISHLELEEGIVLPFMFPPLTCTGEYDRETLRETIFLAREHFANAGQPFSLRLVPQHMVEIIKEAVPELRWKDDRPNYDYIYLTQDLIDLKGRTYHTKKNHLNYFKKTFDYEYIELTSDMADECMQFLDEFNARKDVPENEMEMLKMEQEAMEDVFHNLEAAGYTAGGIRIDGKLEALAVGGQLGGETITEHVEKANSNIRGLYQAINNEYCRHVASRAKYINREEDMGLPNLRAAKLSYRPCMLLEKYIAEFPD